VFLSWIIGSQKSSLIIDFEKKIEEEELTVIPADVSNAVTEAVVEKELECFQSLFTPDAWAAVLQTSKFLFHFICILTSSLFFFS
jgi:hypothetical protein